MFHKIAKFVKNISFMMLSFQSSFLQKRLVKRLGYTKKAIVDGCSVDISQELKQKKEKINADIRGILKQLKNSVENITEYLENHNIKIYHAVKYKKLLKHIKESEGFISERNGYKSLVMNLATGNGFKFGTDDLILFPDEEIDIYKLIRALYSWYSKKEGMAGFDEKSQKLLYMLHTRDEDKIIATLSIPELEGLQKAIARDVEAIEFVTQYSKEYAGSKKALEKIQNEGGANI